MRLEALHQSLARGPRCERAPSRRPVRSSVATVAAMPSGMGVVGAAMHHPPRDQEVHQVGAAGDRGDREAVGDGLAEDGEVGRDAEQRLRAAGRDAEAGDDLVEDQDGAGLRADRAHAFE